MQIAISTYNVSKLCRTASAIALNTAKIGMSKDQADAIGINTAKNHYPITW
jgi:hypothetical protein